MSDQSQSYSNSSFSDGENTQHQSQIYHNQESSVTHGSQLSQNSLYQRQNNLHFNFPLFQFNLSVRQGQQIVDQSFRQSQYQQSQYSVHYGYAYSSDLQQSNNQNSDDQLYFIYENPSSMASNFQSNFLEQQQENLAQMHRYGLSQEQIQNFPEMTWTSTHCRLDKGEQCSFCLQEYKLEDTLKVISCMHRFHRDCISKWLRTKNNCPLCKHILQAN